MKPVTILDGGMGKELQRIGAPFRQPEWSALALIEKPATVAQAHQNFIDAGADVITTNTYACVPFHLGAERYDHIAESLVALAARTARSVADDAERFVLVAGSLPPLFGSYEPELFDAALAPPMYAMMVEAQEPHVDFWLGETISVIAEYEAMAAATERSPKPLWASFCARDDGPPAILSGESVAAVADAVRSRCEAVLFNCSRPESIGPVIASMVDQLDGSDVRVGGYANAFVDEAGEGYSANSALLERRDDLTEHAYADVVAGWVGSGASIVGGCCGMHPEHVAELSARFGGSAGDGR